MKVILLAGGLGTRLSEYTDTIPKPMVHIGGKPMLWHIMNLYARYNHKDFFVALGYKGEIIKEYFSKIKPGKIKAWKYHLKMILNLVVPHGKVKFVFYSQKDRNFRVIEIGGKKYLRLTVPPKIWFGFKGISRHESIILSVTNIKRNPKEILRWKKNKISFDW